MHINDTIKAVFDVLAKADALARTCDSEKGLTVEAIRTMAVAQAMELRAAVAKARKGLTG